MFLRFGIPVDALTDPAQQQRAEAIRQGAAGREIMTVYIFAIGLGAGLSFAGIVLVLARTRLR